ncbi:hypothetical protein D3C73_943040 [compost metagenome]
MKYSRSSGSPGSALNFSAVSSGRLRYPFATCTPPMHSSPGMPTGTSLPSSDTMYRRVFATGFPIGIEASDGCTS